MFGFSIIETARLRKVVEEKHKYMNQVRFWKDHARFWEKKLDAVHEKYPELDLAGILWEEIPEVIEDENRKRAVKN